MAHAVQVDLRVQVHGDQVVEFTLHRPRDAHKSCAPALCWFFAGVSAALALAWRVGQSHNACRASALAAVFAALAYRSAAAAIIEESLLVVPSLGVKLVKKRRNGSTAVKFIDQSDICAVVLNEAITFNDVVYYLAFMVEGQTDMVLAYETFRPRVAVLQQVLREVKAMLFPFDSDTHRTMRLPACVDARAAS